MFSWIKIVQALVALTILVGVVYWIHRASVKQAEKDAPERKSHT